jgi:two-component system, NarL family, response regulator DevR
MHGRRPIDVVIADVDEFMRAGFRSLLSADADVRVVAEAATCADAIRETTRLRPDVVILDGSLPDGSGLVEVCHALQSRQTRVLMVVDRVEAPAVLGAVLAGADGCLAKRSPLHEVRRIVRAVAAGESALDSHAMRVLLNHLRQQPLRSGHNGGALRHTECRVLQLVAAGKTNREIALALAVSERKVKNLLRHAFGKLHVTRRAQAAVRFTLPGASTAVLQEPTEPGQARTSA